MMTAPIRVLHLIASNFVGGPEKQILRHALDLCGSEVEVFIGSFRESPHRTELLDCAQEKGIPIYELPPFRRFDPRIVWNLANFLKAEEIQLLCTHGFKANTIGVLAKQMAGIPQLAFCRGWTAETAAVRLYEFMDRCSLRFADHIVCVSGAQKRILEQEYDLHAPISVVHNAALEKIESVSNEERGKLKTELGFSPQSLLVGAVGRLSQEKGQRYLIDAASQLAKEFGDLKIIVLGEGRDREALQSQISRLGLTNIVHLPGFRRDAARWMRAFDVMVNASLTEGLPNVILEAMAIGTPVVATAVGGVPELIKDGETGILVDARNSAHLSYGVAKVLRNPQFASQLSHAGQKFVKTNFSPERQRERLLALYRQHVGYPLPSFSEDLGSDASGHERTLHSVVSEHSESGLHQAGQDASPFISVVIPVRNEEQHLSSILQDLLSQDYPWDRYEIVVADGNSTDGSAALVEKIGKSSPVRIRLVPNPSQLSSAGRNVGVRHSCGEFIVFIDGHCRIPGRFLLRDTAEIFCRTDADCLCRPQPLVASNGDWFQKVVADARATAIGHGLDSTIFSRLEGFVNPTSSGASYRRQVFDQVGFYDEKLDACEDVEFNYRVFRAGLRSYISPRLTVHYQARSSFRGLWKQLIRYGRGRFRFVSVHPDAFSIGQALPSLWLLWLLLAGCVSIVSSRFALFYFSILAIYGLAVLSYSAILGAYHGWRHVVTAPAVYLTIHGALAVGFLAESFRYLVQRWRRPSQNPVRPTTQLISHRPAEGAFKATALVNAFSVDVEDYFQTEAMSTVVPREQWESMPSRVVQNTMRLFQILSENDVRGTFFFLGWIAERYPELVREAISLGHEIGCHSFWHRPVNRLSPSEFRDDTQRAKTAIEDAASIQVRGYRAPSFSMVQGTEWAVEILGELGFHYDSSVHPIRHDLYGNPSAPRIPHRFGQAPVLELPIATVRIGQSNFSIGGGGYLRFFPYSYTRWGINRLNVREIQPGVMYIHPWEIDPEQPRLPAPLKSRVRQYLGLNSTAGKLRQLFRDFHFAPVSTVFREQLTPQSSQSAGFGAEALRSCSPASVLTTPDPVGGN